VETIKDIRRSHAKPIAFLLRASSQCVWEMQNIGKVPTSDSEAFAPSEAPSGEKQTWTATDHLRRSKLSLGSEQSNVHNLVMFVANSLLHHQHHRGPRNHQALSMHMMQVKHMA
jgi:hypothetical protein